ncbi:MAG: hypothetical protein CFH41_00293 [Alphaproteobacteria bacterium MarineAlpha11_Bin1]|nr:MAG: hypothetical protein CFH41_00293 [Alphaproteobacteria bacterium MarineAlpha11_Bin1]
MNVIDVHAHLVPPDVIETLSARGKDFGIDLLETEPGCHCCRFESGMQVRPFFDTLTNADHRLEEMDLQGVDREILSIWTDIFGYDLPAEKGILWHAALNDSMTRLCNTYPDHFSWLASGALQDAAAASRELERGIKAGAVGAIIAAHVDGKNLGECELDEYWATCVELKAPVFIHPAQPIAPARAGKFALNQIVAYTNDTTLTVGSMIAAGVLDRFPELEIILSHGGGSIPFLIGRFDRMHHASDGRITGNVAIKPPSQYLKHFHYDTILHDGRALNYLGDLVGLDRILLGSDLPFPPGDPHPMKTLRDAGFSNRDIEIIVEKNPSALFGL